MYTFDIDQIYAGLALRIKQCIVIENPKTLKYYLFMENVHEHDQKFENFEGIKKMWAEEKDNSKKFC